MQVAKQVALQSPDPRTKVGCLILSDLDLSIIATGYNNFPTGLKQNADLWIPPCKYDRVIHAEQAAVAEAARTGQAVDGCIAFVSKFPCGSCTRLLLQCGISALVVPPPDIDARWKQEYEVASRLIREAGIRLELEA